MRLILIHPDDPFQAMEVAPLARLVRESGHDVLSIVPAGASGLIAAVDPSIVIAEQDQGLALRVATFKPEAFAAIGAEVPASVRASLRDAEDLLRNEDLAPSVRVSCERLAARLASDPSGQALAGARSSWNAAMVASLRAASNDAKSGAEAEAEALRSACLVAAAGVAEGLGRVRDLEGVSRLLISLRDAILHHAQDAADLQTQLEARAATIQERDDQIASLRSEINGLGLQLDRMHRLGAELQEAHRVAAALREHIQSGQAGAHSDELRARIEALEAELAGERSKNAQLGAELDRTHRIAGQMRDLADGRTAEIATSRARIESLESKLSELHEIGAELRRMHDVASELKAVVESRSARIADVERSLAQAQERAANATIDAARCRQLTEELVRTRAELTQAFARVESVRVNEDRLRAERDTLDELVSARDAELAEVRTLLNAERSRREAVARERDRVREILRATRGEAQVLRGRLNELLASRWRKLGQKLGLAMVMPWEKSPGSSAPPAPPPAAPRSDPPGRQAAPSPAANRPVGTPVSDRTRANEPAPHE